MSPDPDTPPEGNDLARWLVEAGERAKLDGRRPALEHPKPPEAPKEVSPEVRRSVLLILAAAAFLQYYYFHVQVEIARLPAVVALAPPNPYSTPK